MSEVWIERWREGRTGWHQPDGSPSLRRHWRGTGRRVLVPLCGKTPDLLWLAEQGNEVVGVELSEIAVRSFFEEQELAFDVREGELQEYRALDVSITIFQGDYFRLTGETFDAHYDRGALVALPPGHRADYAEHTRSLLAAAAEQLVVTLEYDQDVANGPPYAVHPDEVLGYWPELVRIESHDDLPNGPPKFREAGLTEMIEVVWRSTRDR